MQTLLLSLDSRWSSGTRSEAFRRPRARLDNAHPATQVPVHHLRLRKVRDLRRTCNIRSRRKQIVLHHRPEERIGAELFGLGMRFVHQLLALPRSLAGLKFVRAGGDHLPPAFIHSEEQRAPRCYFHLSIKSCAVQILPALEKFFAQRVAFRSEEHTSELQSHSDLVCRLLLEKKKQNVSTLHIV